MSQVSVLFVTSWSRICSNTLTASTLTRGTFSVKSVAKDLDIRLCLTNTTKWSTRVSGSNVGIRIVSSRISNTETNQTEQPMNVTSTVPYTLNFRLEEANLILLDNLIIIIHFSIDHHCYYTHLLGSNRLTN